MPVDPEIANYNPSAFVTANQQAQANLATTQQEQQLRAQDVGLRQQQVQEAQLKNQLTQRAIQDQEIERQMFRDVYGAQQGTNGTPAQAGAPGAPASLNPLSDPMSYAKYMAAHGASGPAIMSGMGSIVALNTNIAKMSGDQIDLETKNLGKLKDDAVGYLGNPSEAAYADLYQDVVKREPKMADELPAPGQGIVPTQDDLSHFLGKTGAIEQLLTNAKSQAEIKEKAAQTTEEEAKAKHQKLVNDAIERAGAAPQAGIHPVDAIFGTDVDPGIKQAYKVAYDDAASRPPDENGRRPALDSIISAAASHAAEFRKETSPTVRAAKAASAAATEIATAPIKRGNAIAEAKALREGDNPALVGVPPAAAASAVTAATKLDSDYIKAREATESMGKLLDLADASNVAAGANIPMAGVGAVNAINGIRRINSAEMSQYGTAGSLLQKVQGKLEGWTEGQPIPASVRNDIRELHQQLGESAYAAYTQGINSLNQRTGAKFGPTVPAPNIRKAPIGSYKQTATGPGGHRIGSNDGGQTWVDVQTGKKI